jgi:hypothetical protein
MKFFNFSFVPKGGSRAINKIGNKLITSYCYYKNSLKAVIHAFNFKLPIIVIIQNGPIKTTIEKCIRYTQVPVQMLNPTVVAISHSRNADYIVNLIR